MEWGGDEGVVKGGCGGGGGGEETRREGVGYGKKKEKNIFCVFC